MRGSFSRGFLVLLPVLFLTVLAPEAQATSPPDDDIVAEMVQMYDVAAQDNEVINDAIIVDNRTRSVSGDQSLAQTDFEANLVLNYEVPVGAMLNGRRWLHRTSLTRQDLGTDDSRNHSYRR